eukprot:Seg2809.1 transcript_id=Seg2809.1/GoldUCD/mRNA.D3Y31 product="hypothetical protein" protein_id=Seg2809.1/GoldUCD/D3Y31
MSANRDGIDINNQHKYCCSPFDDHNVKWKEDLRRVTESQAKRDDGEIQGELMDQSEIDIDDSFASPESELGTINRSLELIGVSPFKEKNVKRTTSHVPCKKQRVQEAMSSKIDAALAPHTRTPQAREISEKEDAEEIVQSLVKKYQHTANRSEKMSILKNLCTFMEPR